MLIYWSMKRSRKKISYTCILTWQIGEYDRSVINNMQTVGNSMERVGLSIVVGER